MVRTFQVDAILMQRLCFHLTKHVGVASLDGVSLHRALRYVASHLYVHGGKPEGPVSSIPLSGCFEVSDQVPFAGVHLGAPEAFSGALPHLLEVVL